MAKGLDLDSIPFKTAKHYHRGRIKPVELIVIHTAEASSRPESPGG